MMMNDGLAVDCKPNEMENSVAKQQKEKNGIVLKMGIPSVSGSDVRRYYLHIHSFSTHSHFYITIDASYVVFFWINSHAFACI